MSVVKEKIALLKAESKVTRLKGITNPSCSLEKPVGLNWYQGEFLPIDSPIPVRYRLSPQAEVSELAMILEKEAVGETHFILVLPKELPVYLKLEVTDMETFLITYYQESATRDITLFFARKKKAVDLFLAERTLDIRVLEGSCLKDERLNMAALHDRVRNLPTILNIEDELTLIRDLQSLEMTELTSHVTELKTILEALQTSHQDSGIFEVNQENQTAFLDFVHWLHKTQEQTGLSLAMYADGFDTTFDGNRLIEQKMPEFNVKQALAEYYPSLTPLSWLDEKEKAYQELMQWGWRLDEDMVSIYSFPFSTDGTIDKKLYVSEKAKAIECFKAHLLDLASDTIYVAIPLNGKFPLISVEVKALKESISDFLRECSQEEYLEVINRKELVLLQKGEYEWEVLVYPQKQKKDVAD